jgi:restriction endonuclease S subunit
MSDSFGGQWKVPKTWKTTLMKNISSDWRGGAPFKPDDFTEEGFPVLHKGAIHKSGTILIDSKKKTFTSPEYAERYQKSVIDRTYMAVTLRDLVPSGPSIGLIANLADSESEKYVLAQGAYGFHIDKNKVCPSYLVWLSNYEPFRAYIKCYAVGSTQIHIRTPVFQDLEIPLPPLEEQKRIAAILDKADRVRRKRQEAIRLTEELGRSIFLDMFGDPVTNPKGWEVVKLNDICNRITDGTHQSPTWSIEGIPFLFVSNIVDGEIDFNVSKYIDNRSWKDLTSRCPIELNDILYTTVGSYGNAALVRTTDKFCFQRHIAHIKPNISKIHPEFLLGLMQSDGIKKQADRQARGVAQKTLNLRELKAFQVFLPPTDLQEKYVSTRKRTELQLLPSRSKNVELGCRYVESY